MYAARFAGTSAKRRNFDSSVHTCDVAIVTALRIPEFNEVVDALGGGDKLTIEATGESWLTSKVQLPAGREATVIAACSEEMGMCSMAALVTRLSLACRPKKLILTGIMGGNSERVALGDVVLVEETWDCRAGKITQTGFEPDIKGQRCSFKLANVVRSILDDAFWLNAWSTWKGEKPRQIPRLLTGAVACSPAVIAKDDAFKELEAQKRKVLGVEMEAFGCYDAVHRLGDFAPDVICIKAVCDLGNKAKSDTIQQYCAYLGASAVVKLLKEGQFLDL